MEHCSLDEYGRQIMKTRRSYLTIVSTIYKYPSQFLSTLLANYQVDHKMFDLNTLSASKLLLAPMLLLLLYLLELLPHKLQKR
jgi:hypothetical protein